MQYLLLIYDAEKQFAQFQVPVAYRLAVDYTRFFHALALADNGELVDRRNSHRPTRGEHLNALHSHEQPEQDIRAAHRGHGGLFKDLRFLAGQDIADPQ